jgi:outer membrane receptor protein involved in Fe transport
MLKRDYFVAGLMTGASLLALSSPALAQSADGGQVEEIVVTGSRVIQNGNNMPTPVTVVSTEQLLQTVPSTVVAGLQQMPVFAGGRSPTTNPGNSSQNNAFRTLNLRSLGANRTLVLFDGRRVPPTSPNGEVNADFVPSLLLQRVDVVTGGASAVYGSDAVAGVVNFVTDRSFNGLKFNAQYGISQKGDGEETKIGIAGGMPLFGGRGHIEGSYEYFNSPGIFTKLDREWGKNVITVQGAGSNANPYRLVYNTRLNATSFLGNFTNVASNGPLRDMVFRQNGVLDRFQHGLPTSVTTVESGGDGGYFYNASLQSLFQSDLAFGRFDYDISDNVHFYTQVTGMLTHNKNNHETNEVRNLLVSSSNAFLAPQYQQAAQAAGVQTLTFSKMMQQAPVKQPETYTRGYMAQFGLEGTINDWRWDISYVNSQNQQRTRNNANPNNGKLFAAMDAVRAPDGRVVCNVELTHPGLYPGCVPINFFGPTSESAEALNYVLDVTKYVAKTKMDNVGASIAGSPFSTWAGEVGVAVSAEYRKMTYQLSSNAQPLPLDCTGLRFNCRQGTTLRFQSNVLADRSQVSQAVKEAAGEINVPLLKDVPFAQSFMVNGAVRYTDYDTSGEVTTWKLGADWDINDQISIRATRSRDIRAPSLNELFAPQLINPAGVTDLHTGIVGQAPFVTDPNPGLAPEVAKTWTAGVVFRPSFIPRFSLAIDWYKIAIGNAITNIAGQDPTIQGICEASNGTSPFCALIQRPLPFSDRSSANFVTAFYSRPQNAQTVTTKGIDFEANYSAPLFGGNLALRGLVTHQPDFITIQFPGAPVLDAGDTPGQSAWRVTAFAKYTYNNFSLDVQQRWWRGTGWNSNKSLVYAEPRLQNMAYTNVTVGYRLAQTDLYFSVQNLFNKQPTPYGNIGGSSGVPGLFGGFIPGEDTIGRFYTVGLRLRR